MKNDKITKTTPGGFLLGLAIKLGLAKQPPIETETGIGLASLVDRPPQVKWDQRGRFHVAPVVRQSAKNPSKIDAIGCYHLTVSRMGVRVLRADVQCPADMDAFMDGMSLGYSIYMKNQAQESMPLEPAAEAV